jgi:hypothetical protein
VISALREPIESLALAPDSIDLSAVLGLSDQLTAKTLEALGDFDAESLGELDGRTSLRDWLRVEGRMYHRCRVPRRGSVGIEALV